MPKKVTKAQPVNLVLNARKTTTEVDREPTTNHGLNLPHFVRVRSMMLPIIGSLKASKTRAATIIIVIATI